MRYGSTLMRNGLYRVDIVKANHSVFIGVFKTLADANDALAKAEAYRWGQ
jgi:hypothetical protein